MARMGVYEQITKAFQDIVAPEIHELRGEIRRLDQKIDGVDQGLDQRFTILDQKLDGVDTRLTVKLDALDEKIENVDARLNIKLDALRTEVVAEIRRLDARIDGMDRELRTAIDIRERLAALEARRSAGS